MTLPSFRKAEDRPTPKSLRARPLLSRTWSIFLEKGPEGPQREKRGIRASKSTEECTTIDATPNNKLPTGLNQPSRIHAPTPHPPQGPFRITASELVRTCCIWICCVGWGGNVGCGWGRLCMLTDVRGSFFGTLCDRNAWDNYPVSELPTDTVWDPLVPFPKKSTKSSTKVV